MDNLTFGMTLLLVGMGGTLATLWILSLLVSGLVKACRSKEEGGPP